MSRHPHSHLPSRSLPCRKESSHQGVTVSRSRGGPRQRGWLWWKGRTEARASPHEDYGGCWVGKGKEGAQGRSEPEWRAAVARALRWAGEDKVRTGQQGPGRSRLGRLPKAKGAAEAGALTWGAQVEVGVCERGWEEMSSALSFPLSYKVARSSSGDVGDKPQQCQRGCLPPTGVTDATGHHWVTESPNTVYPPPTSESLH